MPSLDVPGARLHYETHGRGPLLLLIGSPMDSTGFLPLAEVMSDDHTCVVYDPRGLVRSTRDDPDADITPEVQADDVHRLIDALGDGPVDLFGSSGGGVVGLALVAAHPGAVRTLVAHEPPVFHALADPAPDLARIAHLHDTYVRDGVPAAMGEFLALIGVEPPSGDDGGWQPTPEQQAAMLATNEVFLAHLVRATTAFTPDVDALRAAPTRIVVGVGATSGGQLAHRTGEATAELLGLEPVVFPGDHVGFVTDPLAFASVLAAALAAPSTD